MHYTIILESQPQGDYKARCVEIEGTQSEGKTPGEALSRIREEIITVREARNEELHKTIPAIGSEIIMIDVADA